MTNLLKRLHEFSFARFLASGAFNTLATYALYLMLLNIINYKASYTITYIFGIFLSYFLNRHFVFKSTTGSRSILLYPLVYLAQYLASMGILWLWIDHLHFNEKVAPLIAVIITIPLTYLLSKAIFTKK
ncbi:GtrA family protein [Pseudomonas sp. lyk4-TYG-107]|uniref:GtrA family protein n=1 Tax=Pseudomonas sp. lyk4-TYG-107 TaxID=3040317 RepID=UPI0025574CB8|nr:GtrA family protein [Pseudomonas sp. lyk4-TYG-107]